jgi:hypothetical protein
MAGHAMKEMAEDDLDVEDIEQAILNGRVAYRGVRLSRASIEGERK